MQDIILVNPCLFKTEKNIWKKIESCFPSLGLASIAGYVRQQGFKVKIIDAPALKISVESFKKFLLDNYQDYQARYFGFTSVTPSIKNAYAMAKIVKQVYPAAKIIFGGVHATFLPNQVINQDEIDIVVRGEGEITLAQILKGTDLSQINGILYQQNGWIVFNQDRQRIKDLDNLPLPAYDLLPMDKYYPAKGSYEKLPAMSMFATRGCPGHCTFCNKTLGNQVVFRSPESLIKEIKLLKDKFGIKQIMFYDDTFTINKQAIKKFCQLLIKQKIDISWCCFSRVDYIDLELLKLMKKSGCHQIMYGIESGDQDVLNSINKKFDLATVRRVVKLSKQAKIDVRGAFMIGSPIETKQTILKTLDFAIELNPEIAIFNITTPYPGTAMFAQAKRKNLITTYDWDDYDLSKPVMRLENLSQNELLDLYKYCYKKFYFRLAYIIMRIKRLFLKPREIVLVLNSLKAVLSFIKK